MRQLFLGAVALCVIGFTGVVKAEDHAVDAPAMAGMPDAAMMQRMMDAGQPGEAHKVLAGLAGTWDYTVRYKMTPDAPEQESTGKSVNTLILGGRFIQENISGIMDMGGQSVPFEGLGLIGYDNVKKEYNSVWIDGMNTAMMISGNGTYDEASKTITESARMYCPMRDAEIDVTSALTVIDADHYTYAMKTSDDKGGMYKMMEITYTRAAAE